MKSKILRNFGIILAEEFSRIFASATGNTYITIGRPIAWGSTDEDVEAPQETTEYMNEVYRDMIAMKKMIGSDIQVVVPREDWVANTAYTQYEDDVDLFTTVKETELSGNVSVNVTTDGTIVVGTSTSFNTDLTINNLIKINDITKEVINIANDTILTVNSAFTESINANLIYKITDTDPFYANKFYVRNSKDQVFKCLWNNESANSTVEPEISIAGQLPENPFIELGDGYKWKYLYTIPAGKKLKFMNNEWMPVLTDTIVARNAVPGALNIIKIINGGTGYISNGNSNSAFIITVAGDGAEANITARIQSGTFTGLNILNGGFGYSTANLIINDTGVTGANAEFEIVYPPQNGHGSDPVFELGASHVMISVELDDDEGGKIPTISGDEKLDYRQIGILRNPRLFPTTAAFANDSVYATTTRITVTAPSSGNKYNLDETVYQGISLEEATFSGVVVHWDEDSKVLHLNETRGIANLSNNIIGNTTGTETIALLKEDTEVAPYTGRLLYLDNRAKVVRNDQQSELIRLVIEI
jgi:hypothetical protein